MLVPAWLLEWVGVGIKSKNVPSYRKEQHKSWKALHLQIFSAQSRAWSAVGEKWMWNWMRIWLRVHLGLTTFFKKITNSGASLVAQWLRVRPPMQGTRVRALVREDPTCHGATGPVCHNYWACTSGACAPQRERPRQWETRAPRWRVAPARRNWREPSHRNEDPTQPKINK